MRRVHRIIIQASISIILSLAVVILFNWLANFLKGNGRLDIIDLLASSFSERLARTLIAMLVISYVFFVYVSIFSRKLGDNNAPPEIVTYGGVEGAPGAPITTNQKILFDYPFCLVMIFLFFLFP